MNLLKKNCLYLSNLNYDWSTDIPNSFTAPYTNSFNESRNNIIKVFKLNTYGYHNFNRFRNRILDMEHIKSSYFLDEHVVCARMKMPPGTVLYINLYTKKGLDVL